LAGAALLTTLLALLTSCATDPGPSAPGRPTLRSAPSEREAVRAVVRPPFFRVAARDGAALSVMGTIHLGPSEGWQPSAEIDQAIARADRFALELNLRSIDPDAVGSLLASLVLLPPGRTIEDVIAPETAKLLDMRDALLSRYGMPRNARVRFKPWYIVVSLIEGTATEAGYDMTQSADQMLVDRIGARPLMGLEEIETQLALFDGLAPAAQDAMLRDTVDRLPEATEELETLLEAWRTADRDELLRLSRIGEEEFPALEAFFERLLVERNRNWVEILAPMLEDPSLDGQEIFVGVGVLHLVGPDGLETLFRDAGFDVERIH